MTFVVPIIGAFILSASVALVWWAYFFFNFFGGSNVIAAFVSYCDARCLKLLIICPSSPHWPHSCFRKILDTEDELQEIKSDAVPSEVRDWLASTFTQQTRAKGRRSEEKPKFRSIVHAVQAGIFVERFGSSCCSLDCLGLGQNRVWRMRDNSCGIE